MAKVIAYYRVSTKGQGVSGLGLEAQCASVAQYLASVGGAEVVAEHTEVESGRNDDRPALALALAAARAHRCPLVVANVSRLTRSSAFLHKLLAFKVDIRFADMPQIEGATGRFLLQQMASVAELEAGMTGERTKKALAAAKARGTKLGGYRGRVFTEADHAAARQARIAAVVARGADLAPIVADIQAEGANSLGAIAKALTARGIETARGKAEWSPMQVSRLLTSIKTRPAG